MPNRYQDIYPEDPLLKSEDLGSTTARELLTLEFFEAEPGAMPHQVFEQHHILINLRDEPTRVENWRDGAHRDFEYRKNEIVVTPAGIRSGWRWYEKSKVIVITLEPEKLEAFAQNELGVLLGGEQLKSIPQFVDMDITQAAVMLMEALKSDIGSDVMFESFARVFLTKLIQKYGLKHEKKFDFSSGFTSRHYKRVFDHVRKNYGGEINLDTMAQHAGLSASHFSRLFKKTIGQSPHQFLMAFRVERAKEKLERKDLPMIDIALSCGFADQAHFSRVFKQIVGQAPKEYRSSL